MPHAALWVVQRWDHQKPPTLFRRFNAARGFVGGATADRTLLAQISRQFQCRTRLCGWCNFASLRKRRLLACFNAARGFVGGATIQSPDVRTVIFRFQCRTRLCGWCNMIASYKRDGARISFNAARGFVGGAASSLSALVPLGGKSSFGKSPEI